MVTPEGETLTGPVLLQSCVLEPYCAGEVDLGVDVGGTWGATVGASVGGNVIGADGARVTLRTRE